MTLPDIILLALRVSIALIVFALGIQTKPVDVSYALRRPGQLIRSLFGMNVVMPLFAAALAATHKLRGSIEIALIALAVSPLPPLLPRKQLKAGGHASYVMGLLVIAALVAIVYVPLAVQLLSWAFGTYDRSIPVSTVARAVLTSVLAPLGAGVLARYAAPRLADKIAERVGRAGSILFLVSVLPLFVTAAPTIAALIGDGTVAAIAAFVVVGLATGHLLGGPEPNDRTVLALSTACRHPGVAIAIAAAIFPEEKSELLAAILLFIVVSGVVSIPYVKWRNRRRAAIEIPTTTPRQ